MNDLTCDEFASQAAELALGLLSGDERAAALAHLAGCSSCRVNLDELARAADALLLVAPRAEPPIGFESRVLARLAADGAAQSARRRWPILRGRGGPRGLAQASSSPQATRKHSRPAVRWIRPLSVAAAVAIMAVTVGVIVGQHTASHARPSAIRTATVWADAGKSTCQVVAIPGQDGHGPELLLRLDEVAEGPSAYPVLVDPANGGRAVPIGMVNVVKGLGHFDAVLPAGVSKIRGVRVLEEDGSLRYQATFSAI
ncbi:MAG TPA: zf-HC2 domain-containing protein [Acidimicrobiales bacterium]|nr:zf-HC2 domain-containing protein [Acidimicrobiales bacterium]